jgi:ATP/maltotriose-dependent transcriptional regulator MalT
MDVLAPGFVAMVLAEVGLTSLPGLLSSYRERGILRRLAVTPVSPARLLAAQPLTQRELQVLELVARGATNREVASRLQVSEATVKTHLVHAFGKLGVSDRTAAVTAALERRLIRLDG